MMTPLRSILAFSLILAAAGVSPASAAHSPLERRAGVDYVVSPAMMHAIDVIVAEKMRMRRHTR